MKKLTRPFLLFSENRIERLRKQCINWRVQ